MRIFISVFIGLLVILWPGGLFAVSFVEEGVWFSKDPFFAGEEITVSTIVINKEISEEEATITFIADGETISSANFVLFARQSEIKTATWRPSVGTHLIKIKLSSSEEEKDLTITRIVDEDTDGDGVGDMDDKDDDNDTLSDEEEIFMGTNVKLADTDGDGITDGEDEAPLEKFGSAKATEVAGGVIETAQETAVAVASTTGPLIARVAKDVMGKLENFRKVQSVAVHKKKEETARHIAESDRVESQEGKAELTDQLQLAALAATGFVLDYQIAFYLALLALLYFVGYKFTRWMLRRSGGDRLSSG